MFISAVMGGLVARHSLKRQWTSPPWQLALNLIFCVYCLYLGLLVRPTKANAIKKEALQRLDESDLRGKNERECLAMYTFTFSSTYLQFSPSLLLLGTILLDRL